MAEFQVVHKYFFIFLALVAFHGSQLETHGRKINIKPLLSHHHSSLNTNIESPPYYEEATRKLGDSGGDNTSAFRPTTPGGSPGVGHKLMVIVQSPDVDQVFAIEANSSKDDFKPTDPGHSPGVGHAYKTKIGLKN